MRSYITASGKHIKDSQGCWVIAWCKSITSQQTTARRTMTTISSIKGNKLCRLEYQNPSLSWFPWCIRWEARALIAILIPRQIFCALFQQKEGGEHNHNHPHWAWPTGSAENFIIEQYNLFRVVPHIQESSDLFQALNSHDSRAGHKKSKAALMTKPDTQKLNFLQEIMPLL